MKKWYDCLGGYGDIKEVAWVENDQFAIQKGTELSTKAFYFVSILLLFLKIRLQINFHIRIF